MSTDTRTQRAGGESVAHVAFAALVLAMLPAVLDQTVLATALPTIARDLGRLSDISWIVTAYVVAATATTPLWGKLGDRHGHKVVLELALGWFVAASALCAVAQDVTQLVGLRALQGVAAGGLMTLAMAAVGDLVAPRERGRYQGYIAATFAGATALGPLLGGLVVEQVSWRWVFLLNLAVGAAALAALALRLPAGMPDPDRRPLDVAGAALLAAATTALMLACVWGGERYAWGSAQVLALLGAVVVLGTALAVRERRAADPLVPLAILASRPVAVAGAGLFLTTAALFAVTVFVPVFLQAAAGASPLEAGLLLVPMTAGMAISTALAGRAIARTGRYKRFPLAGLAVMATALALLAAIAGQRSAALGALAGALFGMGFGMVTQVLVIAVQNSVDRRRLGIATAATGFFRALGGAIGAAVLGAVFAARTGSAASPGEVVDGVRAVGLVAAPLALAALAVVALLPEVPLSAGRPADRPTTAGRSGTTGARSSAAA